MSRRNTQKRTRRIERANRKGQTARNIPHGGIITTKGIVLGQRYLAVKGMPFSLSIAAVAIASAVRPQADFDPTNDRD